MRKGISVVAIMVLALALVGCGGEGNGGESESAPAAPQISEDDAKEAFAVAMISVLTPSMAAAFGQPMPGATLDAETQELTLEDFSLDELAGEEAELPYTSVSGTATPGDESTRVDLTLEGGPVSTIAFDLTPEMFSNEEGFVVKLTLDGHEMEVEITPEDMVDEQ
jgi:hypothetical protein